MASNPRPVIDTHLGREFTSLKKCYYTLLREGHLEQMRAAGKLADYPEEDSYGYYRVRRFYPGRFVERDPDDPTSWEAARQQLE